MNQKRTSVLLVIVVLLAAILMACRPAGPPTILPSPTVWPTSTPAPMVRPTSPPAPTEELVLTTISFACYEWQKTEFARLVEVFESANPDIRIRIVALDEIADLSRLTSETAAQVEPEIVHQIVSAADTAYWVPSFMAIQQGLLLDLAPLIEADPEFDRADFYPAIWQAMAYEHRVWGMPAQADMFVVLYDQDTFDQAGVPYPQPGWDRQDLLAAAQQMTLREREGVRRYGLVNIFAGVLPFVEGVTGSLVDDSTVPARVLLDTPQTVDALQWYVDLALRHEVMPNPAQIPPEWSAAQASRGLPAGQMWLYDLVKTGRAAMWINILASLPPADQSGARQVRVAPLPLGDAPAQLVDVQGYIISSGTTDRDASWRWVKFLSHQRVPGWSPRSLPARASVAQASGYWAQWNEVDAAAIRYTLDHAQAPRYPQVGRALQTAVESIWAGQSVQEALAAAQAQVSSSFAAQAQATPIPSPAVASNETGSTGKQTIIRFSCEPNEKQVWRMAAEIFGETQDGVWIELVDDYDRSSADCFARPFVSVTVENTRAGLLDLQPLIDADPTFSLQEMHFVDAFRDRDALWGLPVAAQTKLVFYNRVLFDRAGVAYPEPGWTAEDLLDKAVALTASGAEGEQYGLAFLNGQAVDLVAFLALQGVELWDEEGRPRFDAPDTMAAVQWFADLALQHHVLPDMDSLPEADRFVAHSLLVRQGRVAMWADWSGIDRSFAFPASMSVGIAPLPVSPDASAAQFIYTGLFISDQTPHTQACWKWIKFASDYVLFPGRIPARRSGWELDVEMWAGEEEDALDTYRAMLGYTPVPRPSARQAAQLEWLYWAFDEILSGARAASALAEAQWQAQQHNIQQ